LISGWDARARSVRDVVPSAPRRRHATDPHRLPSVRCHDEDHASVFVGRAHGLAPACPHTRTPHARGRCRWPSRAVRALSPRPRTMPTRPGPADRATWHACVPLGPPNTPRTPPPSHFLGRRTAPLLRVRRRRGAELASAPCGPPPLLEFKRRRRLHPHPLNPPVHVLWPVDSPAHLHCGRPLPPSPPAVVGAVSRRSNPTKRPRVSPNPTLDVHSPESGHPSPPASLAPPLGTRL
jgi:hypothetical protein